MLFKLTFHLFFNDTDSVSNFLEECYSEFWQNFYVYSQPADFTIKITDIILYKYLSAFQSFINLSFVEFLFCKEIGVLLVACTLTKPTITDVFIRTIWKQIVLN